MLHSFPAVLTKPTNLNLIVNEGYHIRVYVPFGTLWYPYFMKRLADRPAYLGSFFQIISTNESN
jgi:proline dehydrogenase